MNTHSIRRRAPRFELNGDALCLDFVNTLDDRPSGQPRELLNSYGDLARFGEDTGLLELPQIDELMKRSQTDAEEAQRVLRRAIQMREAMHAIFRAIMKKEAAPDTALELLNGYVQEAARHARLVAKSRRFEWGFDEPASLDALLWPIARSAADLLASDQLKFVRACGSKTCQWFFLDTSKNHRRRWCDMEVCGNRAKARRFYARRKKGV